MTAVQFHDLDAEATCFPRPALPMTPVWPTVRIGARCSDGWPTRFSSPDCLRVAGGRYALAYALQAAHVGIGETVLLPAFHCGSMVEPALWIGANVRFYRVLGNLIPEPTELLRLLRTNPRAMVLTHFFGFPQPAQEIRRL
jgi:dTDP-4-amino-4,6-dideoxygalactose transaminase